MSELQPCPFCGAAVYEDSCQQQDPDNSDAYSVCCGSCGAGGPLHMLRQIAIVRWNQRALITEEERRRR